MNEQIDFNLIDNQLKAYNNKDIQSFLECWNDDAKMFLHPNTLIADGIEQIKERHLIRFQEPNLYAKLISRNCYSGKIVDQEVVTRNLPEGKATIEVLAIYEIENKRISKVWFLIGEPRF